MKAKSLIVADAGPLIALAIANVLPEVVAHFGHLLVPSSVVSECLSDLENPGAVTIKTALSNTTIVTIQENEICELDTAYASGLGTGEIAVIAYALQQQYIALVDDERARQVAQRLGVQIIRSGAILVALKKSGLIPSIKPALKAWQDHGYFLTDAVLAELVRRANESE